MRHLRRGSWKSPQRRGEQEASSEDLPNSAQEDGLAGLRDFLPRLPCLYPHWFPFHIFANTSSTLTQEWFFFFFKCQSHYAVHTHEPGHKDPSWSSPVSLRLHSPHCVLATLTVCFWAVTHLLTHLCLYRKQPHSCPVPLLCFCLAKSYPAIVSLGINLVDRAAPECQRLCEGGYLHNCL